MFTDTSRTSVTGGALRAPPAVAFTEVFSEYDSGRGAVVVEGRGVGELLSTVVVWSGEAS